MEPKPEPVGTELSKLIPRWAVRMSEGCGCKDMAKKMDAWGADVCEARSDEIVAHLLSQDEYLIPAIRLVPKKMKDIAARRLLIKAISNAREKASLP